MKNCSCNFDLLKKALEENEAKTEKALDDFFLTKSQDGALNIIYEAQRYSLLGGGKRIRPFLVNEVCRMLGGSIDASMPYAMAVEMIHTYSLIHDDLPCMDDDDYRRGKLTNHKVFGEATAVLAGDALLTKAFEVIANAPKLSAEAKIRAVALLSNAAGELGMIGGQIMDMQAEKGTAESHSLEYLTKMHSLKTGALIRVSAKLGCLAAGLDEAHQKTKDADRYAAKIGLAFQVIDDVLDVIGDAALLGKSIGSDKDSQKLTFMKFYTVENALDYARALTDEAIHAVKEYDSEGELQALAAYLLNRKK